MKQSKGKEASSSLTEWFVPSGQVGGRTEEAGALVCLAPGDLALVCLPWKPVSGGSDEGKGGAPVPGLAPGYHVARLLSLWIRGGLGKGEVLL